MQRYILYVQGGSFAVSFPGLLHRLFHIILSVQFQMLNLIESDHYTFICCWVFFNLKLV